MLLTIKCLKRNFKMQIKPSPETIPRLNIPVSRVPNRLASAMNKISSISRDSILLSSDWIKIRSNTLNKLAPFNQFGRMVKAKTTRHSQ